MYFFLWAYLKWRLFNRLSYNLNELKQNNDFRQKKKLLKNTFLKKMIELKGRHINVWTISKMMSFVNK